MKNIDLLSLWDKINAIDSELKLHRQEHRYLLYLIISITSIGFLVFSPGNPLFSILT